MHVYAPNVRRALRIWQVYRGPSLCDRGLIIVFAECDGCSAVRLDLDGVGCWRDPVVVSRNRVGKAALPSDVLPPCAQ